MRATEERDSSVEGSLFLHLLTHQANYHSIIDYVTIDHQIVYLGPESAIGHRDGKTGSFAPRPWGCPYELD